MHENHNKSLCRLPCIHEIRVTRVRHCFNQYDACTELSLTLSRLAGYAIRPVHAGPEGLEGSEELEAVHRFSKVTAWNHDVKAADSDSLPALLEWAAVSSILHAARPTA
jgi:hypothetical protein